MSKKLKCKYSIKTYNRELTLKIVVLFIAGDCNEKQEVKRHLE